MHSNSFFIVDAPVVYDRSPFNFNFEVLLVHSTLSDFHINVSLRYIACFVFVCLFVFYGKSTLILPGVRCHHFYLRIVLGGTWKFSTLLGQRKFVEMD